MKKILLTLTTLIFSFSVMAQEVPLAHYLNFDGQLVDASNTPITSPTSVTFEIFDGGAGNCLLYRETQNVTPDADGIFSTKIGPDAGHTQHSVVDGDVSWPNIFKNSGSIRSTSSVNCTSGYTPAATHARKLRVTVGATVLTPDYTIAPVPMATVAETLQGKRASDFLESTPSGGTAVLTGDLSITQQLQLRDGPSNYVALQSPNGLATTLIFILPNSYGGPGQVLSTNGSGELSWVNQSGGGAVTSVFGRTGTVTQANGDYTASQITNVGAGGVSGVTVQAAINELDAEKLSIAGGSMSGALAMSGYAITGLVNPVNNQDAATKSYVDSFVATFAPGGIACSPSQILSWNGSAWTCVNLPIGLPGSGTAGQLLKLNGSALPEWSSLMSGSNSASSPSLAFSSAPTTGLFSVSTSNLGFSTGGTERMRINSGGNLGIGTQTPEGKLHVEGNVNSYPLVALTATGTMNPAIWATVNGSASLMELYYTTNMSLPKLMVNQNGVGINTAFPTAELDVGGIIQALNLNVTNTIHAASVTASAFFKILPTSSLPACDASTNNEVRLKQGDRKICICDGGASTWRDTMGTGNCDL